MPYDWTSGKPLYFDPIKISERSGLDRVVREPLDFWTKSWQFVDKYDIFAEYPFLEEIDYNRLVFEKINGIYERNRQWINVEPFYLPYCCYPTGCVLSAAMGATLHWTWRREFEKQLPYWRIRETGVK